MRFEDYRTFRTAVGGRLLQLEIGKVCEMANGQVMVKYGDTVVNVTATASAQPRQDIDFFPLSVDYEERMYAAGKIPGGFIKREGRPSEKAILSSRLIDRPIRPLFPKGFYNDVQVVATVMCVDPDCAPEIAAMIGSSVALSISDIPFDGPTASVLVGLVDGQFVVNPTLAQREVSDLHLVVSGTKEAIMMVEAGANEIKEDVMLEAIMFAHEEIKSLIEFIDEIIKEVGKPAFVYHLGDWDYDGVHASQCIRDELRRHGAKITYERLAVTPEQIAAYGLPTRPQKTKSPRRRWFVKEFGDTQACELDAMPPRELRRLLRAAITQHINKYEWEMSELIEKQEQFTQFFSEKLSLAAPKITTSEKDRVFMEEIQKILNANLSNADFSVDDFAGMINLGRTVFFKRLKDLTGYSPNDYIRVYRLKVSEELLRSGEYTVSEVGFKVGFKDPFYFSRRFKEQYGISPSLYQKNNVS